MTDKEIKTRYEALKEIEKRDGAIMPANVVADAKDENHPLHESFEWNDTRAAQAHRLAQARTLIKTIRIEVKERKILAFKNVEIEISGEPQRVYMSSVKVLNNEALRMQSIRNSLKNLEYWKKDAEDFEELKGIVNEDKLKEAKKKYE